MTNNSIQCLQRTKMRFVWLSVCLARSQHVCVSMARLKPYRVARSCKGPSCTGEALHRSVVCRQCKRAADRMTRALRRTDTDLLHHLKQDRATLLKAVAAFQDSEQVPSEHKPGSRARFDVETFHVQPIRPDHHHAARVTCFSSDSDAEDF